MKKAILAVLVFVSLFVFTRQSVDAQDFVALLKKSKPAQSGLEVYNYKKVPLSTRIEGKANKIGLTNERIRTKCELRLRQAGLQPEAAKLPPGLFITVHIADPAFFIGVHFSQLVIFEANQTPYFMTATTWSKDGMGTNPSPEYIIQCLDGYLDSFLNEYLEANTKKGKKE